MTPELSVPYGWFETALSETPERDPGVAVSCPVCRSPLTDAPFITESFLVLKVPDRSYFVRAHKTCAQTQEWADIVSSLVDGIAAGVN